VPVYQDYPYRRTLWPKPPWQVHVCPRPTIKQGGSSQNEQAAYAVAGSPVFFPGRDHAGLPR